MKYEIRIRWRAPPDCCDTQIWALPQVSSVDCGIQGRCGPTVLASWLCEKADDLSLISATATPPITAAIAMARKFCARGSFIETSTPITIGAAIAPMRPTPEAKPSPVERIDVG